MPSTAFKKKKKEGEGCLMRDSIDQSLQRKKASTREKDCEHGELHGVETSGYSNSPYVFLCFSLLVGGLILVQLFMFVLM